MSEPSSRPSIDRVADKARAPRLAIDILRTSQFTADEAAAATACAVAQIAAGRPGAIFAVDPRPLAGATGFSVTA